MVRTWQMITGKKILLPFYHAVAPCQLPHIRHLYRMKTTDEFECDLDFLLKTASPVDADTLYHYYVNGTVPEKPIFHLTFDDGLREMAEVVAPILLKKGIPATFFVNTGFVDNQALFYRYHASLAIEELQKEGKLTREQERDILSCSYLEKDKLFQYFPRERVHVFLKQQKPYLSLSDILMLSRRGFTFGAHSIDHPYYYELPLNEQLRQTRESVRFIYHHVQQRLKLFAFPFTDFRVSKEFFKAIAVEVDLTFGTAGLKSDMVEFNVQRIPAESTDYVPLETLIRRQYARCALRRLLGKNVIKRD